MDEVRTNTETPKAPRLLDRVREAIARRHYSPRTEEAYVHWIKRFIYFSGRRHPAGLGAAEVTAFLNHLARERTVAAATQNQALSALVFLYREVLGAPLPWLDKLDRVSRPARVPTVLSPEEVQRLLAAMRGAKWIMASLLYGAGLRLRECLRLRVKDLDFDYRQIVVRDSGVKQSVDSGWLGAQQRWTVSHLATSVQAVARCMGFAWLPRQRILFSGDRNVSCQGGAYVRSVPELFTMDPDGSSVTKVWTPWSAELGFVAYFRFVAGNEPAFRVLFGGGTRRDEEFAAQKPMRRSATHGWSTGVSRSSVPSATVS